MPTDDFWEFDDLKDDDIPEYVKHLLEKGSYTDKQKKYIYQIPWKETTCPEIEIERAKEILDSSHFGMHDVKQQILRYLACQKHLGTAYGDVLLLVGPPGVGKTSIVKAIASSMIDRLLKSHWQELVMQALYAVMTQTIKTPSPVLLLKD